MDILSGNRLMNAATKKTRHNVLERHVERLGRSIREFETIDRRYFWLRVSVILIGLVGVTLSFSEGMLESGFSMLVTAAFAFVVVVIYHRRLDTSLLRFRLAREQTRAQMARMNLDWGSIPRSLADTQSPETTGDQVADHPFERDLEISGEYSIHRLVDTSLTPGGSRRLKSWLLNTSPDIEQIQARQSYIREMRPLVGFRSRLALNSAMVTTGSDDLWSGEQLLGWLDMQEADRSLRIYLLILGVMSLVNISLFILNLRGILSPLWVISLGIYGIVYNFKYRQYRHLFEDTYMLARALEQFRVLFEYLERYPYQKRGRLIGLCRLFWEAENLPSRSLRKISLLVSAASLRNNPIAWFITNALVPWDLFFTERFQQFTRDIRNRLPGWLEVWYELEALNSLANFSYLNPDYVLPDVTSGSLPASQPVFEVRSLGHPLIPETERVCNDFPLDRLGEVVIVSGSNMSGKSTFLRTLGVNLVLAYAGGPVSAVSMRTIVFRLHTSINLVDSLADGISYFYAEVKRLKALLSAYQKESEIPLFFLIDEIYRGTNNRERQIGSRAYVRSLVGGRGVGVISTHDLALVHLADDQVHVLNYHFREDVDDNRMIFDYKLRPGPCPTTNALKIMSIEGLPVE